MQFHLCDKVLSFLRLPAGSSEFASRGVCPDDFLALDPEALLHALSLCTWCLSSTYSESAWVQAELKLARHVAQGQYLDLTQPEQRLNRLQGLASKARAKGTEPSSNVNIAVGTSGQ